MITNPACRVVSNKLRVEIQGPPAGYTISSNSPACSGLPLLFKADGAASYEWNGPNGFYDTYPPLQFITAHLQTVVCII